MAISQTPNNEHIAFAVALADEARSVLTIGQEEQLGVEVKPDRSLVTQMDLRIEHRLRELIGQTFPDHGIIGEEEGDSDVGASHVWILDPIDGTAPFIAGIPVYGTLIALAVDGVPVLGIIDIPEISTRWVGAAGHPTTRNGQPVRTRDCKDLAHAMMTNSNQDYMSAAELPALDALRRKTATRVYGGASLNYGRLADGRTDLAIDAGQKLFDFAPFRPIIEGAGGVVTDWVGQPLTIHSSGQILAAGSAGIHAQALEIVHNSLDAKQTA